jgi:predicted small lipoprotein YifL
VSGGSPSPAATCPSPQHSPRRRGEGESCQSPSPRLRGEGRARFSGRVRGTRRHQQLTLFIPLVALVLPLALAGCGKRGPPEPPPGEPVTYPRTYPSE